MHCCTPSFGTQSWQLPDEMCKTGISGAYQLLEKLCCGTILQKQTETAAVNFLGYRMLLDYRCLQALEPPQNFPRQHLKDFI